MAWLKDEKNKRVKIKEEKKCISASEIFFDFDCSREHCPSCGYENGGEQKIPRLWFLKIQIDFYMNNKGIIFIILSFAYFIYSMKLQLDDHDHQEINCNVDAGPQILDESLFKLEQKFALEEKESLKKRKCLAHEFEGTSAKNAISSRTTT